MERRAICAGVAALVLGASGCGGSAKSLTRAEFMTRADAVCKQARRASTSSREILGRLVVVQRTTEAGFKGLKPPTELQRAFDEYMDALTTRDQLIRRFRAAVKARSRAQLDAVNAQGAALETRQHQAIATLGLKVCT